MRIPFNGPSYQARSVQLSAQRCINLFLEQAPQGGKTPAALYPTPGLRLFATCGAGPHQGAMVCNDGLYVVSGGRIYTVASNGVAVDIGGIGSPTGMVGMAFNGTQLLIVDGTGGYLVKTGANTVNQIGAAGFPTGVTIAAFLDGYFVVTGDRSQRFWVSALYDGTSWSALDVASAEGDPDGIVGMIVDHRELWLFGQRTTEVWIDSGGANFPLQRLSNAFIEYGLSAAQSVAKMDNTIFWLGSNATGDGIVWRANGYVPERISTHAIEQAIARYSKVSDAVAYTYQDAGHSFYVLTFPTGDATWVYDVATGLWHERASRDPLTGALHRHKPNTHVFAYRQHLVGDSTSGKLYALDQAMLTDNGDPILRLRSSPPEVDSDNQYLLFFGRFQLDLDSGVGLDSGQGSAPVAMMRHSDDGGHTWSSSRQATMGRVGEYRARCKWERNGYGRVRCWEVSWSDPVDAKILGATVTVTKGNA